MKVAEYRDIQTDVLPEGRGQVISLPLGLLGFESLKNYLLIASAEEAPFCWLQVVNEPSLAFLVVSPFEVDPGYEQISRMRMWNPWAFGNLRMRCSTTLLPSQNREARR